MCWKHIFLSEGLLSSLRNVEWRQEAIVPETITSDGSWNVIEGLTLVFVLYSTYNKATWFTEIERGRRTFSRQVPFYSILYKRVSVRRADHMAVHNSSRETHTVNVLYRIYNPITLPVRLCVLNMNYSFWLCRACLDLETVLLPRRSKANPNSLGAFSVQSQINLFDLFPQQKHLEPSCTF